MSNQIGLYYQDKGLRNDFLAKLVFSYKSEVSIQDYSPLEDKELEKKSISIENNLFSFVLGTQHQQLQKPEFNIFLFEVGEEIQDLFYESIDERLVVPERLFVIICKPSPRIKQATVSAFRNSLLQAFSSNLSLQVDPKMVLQICLNDPKDTIPAIFAEKLGQWANRKKQIQDSLGKEEGLIVQVESSLIDRNELNNQLTQIIQSYKISKSEQCLDQLLNGNIEDAILMVKKADRKQFKEDIEKCQLLERFLNSKISQDLTVQTSLDKLKSNASETLLKIFEKYEVKNKQQCVQNLLENNLEDALLYVKKSERPAFKKDVQACKELLDLWQHLRTPSDNSRDNKQELLKMKAELEVKEILQAYGVSDIEQLRQLIFEGKLNQVLCQVPKKHRAKLQQDCNKCNALSEYVNFISKKTQDPRSQLISQLEKILTKYQIKEIKGHIEQIMEGDIELVVSNLPAKMQKSVSKDLKNCQKLRNHLQQSLKGPAQAQINDLLSKYNVGDPEQLEQLLLNGKIDEVLQQLPKRKRDSFSQDHKKCAKLAKYLMFISDISVNNEQENQTANFLKENAKKALQLLIKKYKIKKEVQCIEALLENNLEDAILFVNKDSREKVKQEISKCKEYMLFQQQLQNKTEQNSIEVVKDKAINSLKKIFEKYSIKNDEQCLEDLLNKKVEDASMYTKKNQRQKFISDIQSNKELIQYWKGQQNNNKDDKLYEEASQAVIKILQNYGVSQIQTCLDFVLKNDITAALEQVHPRRRQACQKDLNSCQQLSEYRKTLKTSQVDKEQQVKNSLKEICISFNVKQVDECISQILAGQTDSAIFHVVKANRQSFLRAVNTCQSYQRFIKNKSGDNKGDCVSKVKQSLSKILTGFQVENIDQCLEEILRGDLKEAEFNVKKSLRVEFKRQIQESAEFRQYISSLKPQNKQQVVLRKAKDSIRSILSKYVEDVQECLQLFFNNKVNEVLEEIRPSKKAIFQKEVNDSKDYQDYLQSIKANGSKQQIETMKTMLLKLNLGESKLTKYVKDLQQCKLHDLKEEIGVTFFYQIVSKLVQQLNYSNLLVQHAQNNIGYISYFYFLVINQEQLDQITTKLLNYVESDAKIYDGGLWLEQLVSLQPQLVIMKIEAQIVLLKQAGLSNDKAKSLVQILDLIKRLCLIGVYKSQLDFLQDSLKDHQLGLQGVTQKKHEKKLKLLEMKDKFAKEQCQKEIIHLEKILKASEKIKEYQKMLGISSCMDLAFQYTNKLYEQKILVIQIPQLVSKFSKAAALSLTEKNQQNYFANKKLEIGYRIYNKFFNLFKEEVDSLMVEVTFQENSFKVFLSNQLDYDILGAKISKEIGKNISQVIVELIYDDRAFILSKNPGQLFQKPNTIKCFKKIQVNLQFKQAISKVHISKHLKPQSLKIIVHQSLQNSTMKISLDNICLFGVFGESSLFEITQEIDVIEMKKLETLKFLKAILKVSINVYYEVESFRFLLQEDKSIEQLKKLILEKSKVPINSQSLFYVKDNQQQLVFSQTFQQISPDSCNLTFILISKMNLEHYGFHQNYRLTFEDFSEFFVEKEDDLQNMVDSCSLKKEEEKNFFDQLIKFLYSAIKRRFPFSHVTDEVKKLLVSKNSQQIWSGSDFSNSFLIYYILYNADQKLRIQLMNILRDYVPLPLYFREFDNINQIKSQWIINHELIWLLHEGLCITSIGLHTEKIKAQKGKTFLNNQIFYTKFEKARARHQISSGCPQIMLKIIGSTKMVNIIDIPSETPDNIVEQILGVTDLLIIHSWRGRKDTEKFIEDTKKTFGISNVVAILRDCNSKEQTNYKVNQAKFQSNCFLELHNLEQNAIYNQQLTFMPKLREKIWELSDNCYKKSLQQQTKCIYKMFKNTMFENFNAKIDKLLNNFLKMKVVFEKYEKIKDLKKRNTNASLQEANTIKENVIKNKVAKQFEQILRFINQNKKYSEFLMLRFRQKLKEKKSKQDKKYYAIASYQKKIGLLPQENKEEIKNFIDKACNQINKLEGISINKKETKDEMEEELSRVYKYYDNEIKSNFFTIELAWRQLQYLTTLSSEVKLDDDYFIDFLIDIKRKEIANSQPFEILDGDLLEMPKKIMKKVFEGINERVAVITILGPQSSGKSTLLNFLFGCDFGTSEGRCTKGAYGTYFKFSNIMPANCDGIFLIDTEGLFAEVNKKDQTRRKEFDAKLVLFCLAVSDFVFFNTKGNLDATSTKILTSSLERFAALAQENIQSPEIFLILNQNNSSDMATSFADINKLKDIFKVQNANSLSQAYNTTEFAKSNIRMLGQDDIITKKEPKKQFLELTNKIQHSLIKKIQAKNSTKHISVVIDLMERVWETIEAFPDLGKTSSKKIQEIEKKIKQWRIEKIENLTLMREKVFNQFKQNKINEKKCQDLFSLERESIQNQFRQTFLSDKQLENMADQQKLKIQLEEKKIQLAFEAVKYQLISQIKDLEKVRLAEKSKSEGGQYQKQAIRVVKKIQRETKKQLSVQERTKYFDEAFNKSLQMLQMIACPQQQLQSCFERTYQFYLSASSISVTHKSKNERSKNAGLPRPQWKCEEKMSYEQFSQLIREKVMRLMGKESNKYIEFKKDPPTKVLDQAARTDAKLEYFNMRNYFQKVKICNYYEISRLNFSNCLKFDLLKNLTSEMYAKKSKFQENIIMNIFESLNNCFEKFGFRLQSYNNFQTYLDYQTKFFTFYMSQPQLKIKIIQQKLFKKSSGKKKNGKQKSLKKGNKSKDISSSSSYFSNQGYAKNYSSYQVYNGYSYNSYYQPSVSHQSSTNPNQTETYQYFSQDEDDESIDVSSETDYVQNNLDANLSYYLNIELLEKKIKQLAKSEFNSALCSFLGKCLKNIIKWSQIKKKIEQSKEFSSIKGQINKQLAKILNQDLSRVGLSVSCQDFYELINKGRQNMMLSFQRTNEIKSFESEADLFKSFKLFEYFDEVKIRQNLKKSLTKSVGSPYSIQIGAYYEKTFQVKAEYRNHKQLQTYISDSTNTLYVNLSTDTMKDFVFNELHSKGTISLLFRKIDAIIAKSANSLNLNTVTGIFIDVNRQLTQFNNDLAQVSHKLTLLFTGYVHLYAVYLTWKHFSEMALKIANKPYFDFLQNRQKQLSFFLKETSGNDNERVIGQAERLLNEVIEYCKVLIGDHKRKVNENEGKKFKSEYPRAVIQSKLDNECFSTSSKPDDWIKYLTSPKEIIEEKYNQLTKFTVGTLGDKYKLCDNVLDIMKEFKQVISLLLDKLKSEGLTEDTIHTDIVGLVGKGAKEVSVSDNQVLEKINFLMMEFLLDILVKDEKVTYTEVDFNITIKNSHIKIQREPTPAFQSLIKKLKVQKQSITRFYLFVETLYNKLYEFVEVNGVKQLKFDEAIKKMMVLTAEDEKDFVSRVAVKICQQMCPGCQRICGVEEPHTNKHQCKFGHQMRALGRVKLSNGDASVIRCEDVPLMSQLEFNGKKMTWSQFKQYWEKKQSGSWSFADLSANTNKEIFIKAWDITGQVICKNFQMNYVKSNAIEAQKASMAATSTAPTHYIFVLDDSGSMTYNNRWNDLMTSYKAAIQAIKKIPGAEKQIKVSVLIEGSNCIQFQENVTPNAVNLTVPARFSGNNFADTFSKAYSLMTKYISGAKIKLIFMTDGGDNYPSSQISQIKHLKNAHPKNFQYYGIQFQTNENTMKLISKQLDGLNKISHNVTQLTTTYIEIINRKD